MSGWIKLHRSLLDWEWYDDINVSRLFLHLMLKANHKDRKYKGTLIKRGQLLTGRELLSNETGLSQQQIRTCLTKLKSTSDITIKSTSKGTLVTVINYDDWQGEDSPANQPINQPTNQQVTSDQPAINQQVTTTKNVKNERMEENTPLQIRIGKLVKRRESTKWSDKEIKALSKLKPTEEDIAFLESKDYVNHPYRRQDLFTLLNNWSGELDRMNATGTRNNSRKSILDS